MTEQARTLEVGKAEVSTAGETWEWEEDQNQEPPKWRADTGRGTYQAVSIATALCD